MISIIAKLSENNETNKRFLWSIADSFPCNGNSDKIEVLFFGRNILNIQTSIHYRIFDGENNDWSTFSTLAKQAFGDVLVFSDINIMFTENNFTHFVKYFDNSDIVIPKIISANNNRIIDFGAIIFNGRPIYPGKGLLYDCDYLPKKQYATNCSALVVSMKKNFFLSYCDQTESFNELFSLCYKQNLNITAEGQFIVYYCGEKNINTIVSTNSNSNVDFVHTIIKNNLSHLNKKNLCKSYLLIRIGTFGDIGDIFKKFKSYGINIIATYDFPALCNSEKIDLIKTLPFDIINYHTAIIYLVPSFMCLSDNSIWFSARDISYDLVIDGNLNVLHLYQIANNII